MNATTRVWRSMLTSLLYEGRIVTPSSPGADWRGRTSRELIAYQTTVPMTEPIVLDPARKLSKKFLVAEPAWVASGDNRVKTIEPFNRQIKRFSDDGIRFFGAYGPRFKDQLSYVTSTLAGDLASRQAVIQVWREQPRSVKDIPCTLSWQFLIREAPDDSSAKQLNCVATMRSSDAWTGWVYDVPVFSVCAAIVVLELRWSLGMPNLGLGDLTITAGSQHLYEIDVPLARDLVNRSVETVESQEGWPSITPLDLDEFSEGDHLIDHLWRLARGEATDRKWLRELFA